MLSVMSWALDCFPYATRAQFERAYPRHAEFRAIKHRHDPAGRFSNEMWRKNLGV